MALPSSITPTPHLYFPRYYMSIDGDSTISLHKEETESEYHPLHDVEFPEGVDCMISGILTYVLPTQ